MAISVINMFNPGFEFLKSDQLVPNMMQFTVGINLKLILFFIFLINI